MLLWSKLLSLHFNLFSSRKKKVGSGDCHDAGNHFSLTESRKFNNLGVFSSRKTDQSALSVFTLSDRIYLLKHRLLLWSDMSFDLVSLMRK